MRLSRNARVMACFIHFSLEDISELHVDAGAFPGEPDIDSVENLFGGVEPEAESRGGLHVAKAHVAYPGGDPARIGEERHLQARNRLPPVFRIQDDRVSVAEAEVFKTAHVVRTSHSGQHVEGDSL